MATGVLVVGIGKATRLLGHLALSTKSYAATIRLGQSTSTDDADGEVITAPGAAGLDPAAIRAAAARLTGEIRQVPPGISAVKVGGRRAYQLTRSGTAVELAPRAVTVHELAVLEVRTSGDVTDVDVTVSCSSGTYVRAIARDLGAALGSGGHLTALLRTRVGRYQLADARTLDQLAEALAVIPLADAAAAEFGTLRLDEASARRLSHGGSVAAGAAAVRAPAGRDAPGQPGDSAPGSAAEPDARGPLDQQPVAAFGPDGSLIALVRADGGQYRPLVVFAG
jgi:tRNA pseudouridine55 synthase